LNLAAAVLPARIILPGVFRLLTVPILVGKNPDQRTWGEYTQNPQNSNPFETFIHESD
jgi:hypothetical protein